MSEEKNVVGIIAGSGQFPHLVARGARNDGHRVVAVGFTNITDTKLADEVDVWDSFHLGQLGRLISFFQKNGVRDIIFAGAIHKPSAFDIRPDWRATKLILKLKGRGDDSILRTVAGELESEGMVVKSALELVPSLRTPAGNITARKPDAREMADIRYATPIVRELGKLDIGQCVVVKNEIIAAVEAIEGTDACILRAGSLVGQGGVVVKFFKPNQDNRLDLPALGKKTIETMIEAKASCLALDAGRSLFFDLEESVKLADEHKIAIIGLEES